MLGDRTTKEKTMITLKPFNESAGKDVIVNWDYALKAVENLDTTYEEEGRKPLHLKTIIHILAEYGAIAYQCSSVPKELRLAIVISPPIVNFCPSKDGVDGIFIEEYSEEKHGKCFLELTKNELCCYTNIDGRIDGWRFFGGMVLLGQESK